MLASTLFDTVQGHDSHPSLSFNILQIRKAGGPMASVLHYHLHDHAMFKISIVESRGQRKLVLEGTLVPPWTAEVENAWRIAGEQLDGRKLIIDLTNVTLISRDGENTLFELMREGAKFSCGGVMTRHVLKQLARKQRCKP
jgi:hypothetical protein